MSWITSGTPNVVLDSSVSLPGCVKDGGRAAAGSSLTLSESHS